MLWRLLCCLYMDFVCALEWISAQACPTHQCMKAYTKSCHYSLFRNWQFLILHCRCAGKALVHYITLSHEYNVLQLFHCVISHTSSQFALWKLYTAYCFHLCFGPAWHVVITSPFQVWQDWKFWSVVAQFCFKVHHKLFHMLYCQVCKCGEYWAHHRGFDSDLSFTTPLLTTDAPPPTQTFCLWSRSVHCL
jgi:hypothetical protein